MQLFPLLSETNAQLPEVPQELPTQIQTQQVPLVNHQCTLVQRSGSGLS